MLSMEFGELLLFAANEEPSDWIILNVESFPSVVSTRFALSPMGAVTDCLFHDIDCCKTIRMPIQLRENEGSLEIQCYESTNALGFWAT
jgi:hypothetical protein